MEPFRLCLALGPLAIYLLFIAAMNLSRRPYLVSGPRDTAALGVGVAGLMFVGPIELLLPQVAVDVFHGPYVWLTLATIYALVLSLWVLLSRPRLVVYNAAVDQIRPVLAEVIDQLDEQARWAGNSLSLPRLHVHCSLDAHPALRTVSLVATSDQQSYQGWRQLELALARSLRATESPPNLWGLAIGAIALGMMARMGWELVFNQPAVTQGFAEMLRIN